jgi:Ger(x)C family germination protein
MKKRINVSTVSVVVYWLFFLALLGLYFTNDFGLVDIHKTAIITAVGIDTAENEVQVTAEIAIPQPSQSGENIKYTQVQGSGVTIADALNEINAKTGFYPKLQFCKLVLLGDSCKDKQLFRLLACFYRKNFSELTALVAMCEGNAADMLAMKSDTSDMTSEAIRKVLSDEIEKSANATPATLKDIAQLGYSKSAACYMPYVEASEPGTSENGGDGDNVGGDGGNTGESESGGSQSGSGSQGGGEGGSGGGGAGSAQSGSTGGETPMQFNARKTAIFSQGEFKGILNEQQAFALAAIENDIRLAVLPCDADGVHYTIGMKNVKCGVSLKVNDGVPALTVKFTAKAQINGAKKQIEPNKILLDDAIPDEVLSGAEEALKERFSDLITTCREENCDLIGIKDLLYKYNTKYFEAFEGDILTRMEVKYEVKIESVA